VCEPSASASVFVNVDAEPNPRRTPPVLVELPGEMIEQVAAERIDLVAHLTLRALTEADGENHRGDPNEDAQHREARAQPMRPHGLETRPDVSDQDTRLQSQATACERSSVSRAVANVHDTVGGRGDIVLVRDQHDRSACRVETLQQREHFGGRHRIEVAGRFVGEDQCPAR